MSANKSIAVTDDGGCINDGLKGSWLTALGEADDCIKGGKGVVHVCLVTVGCSGSNTLSSKVPKLTDLEDRKLLLKDSKLPVDAVL